MVSEFSSLAKITGDKAKAGCGNQPYQALYSSTSRLVELPGEHTLIYLCSPATRNKSIHTLE
jgi:hypothetical protein